MLLGNGVWCGGKPGCGIRGHALPLRLDMVAAGRLLFEEEHVFDHLVTSTGEVVSFLGHRLTNWVLGPLDAQLQLPDRRPVRVRRNWALLPAALLPAP